MGPNVGGLLPPGRLVAGCKVPTNAMNWAWKYIGSTDVTQVGSHDPDSQPQRSLTHCILGQLKFPSSLQGQPHIDCTAATATHGSEPVSHYQFMLYVYPHAVSSVYDAEC